MALFADSIRLGFIAIATCIRTNQNPNSVRRCFAPPHTIWVLSLLMPNYLQIIRQLPYFYLAVKTATDQQFLIDTKSHR